MKYLRSVARADAIQLHRSEARCVRYSSWGIGENSSITSFGIEISPDKKKRPHPYFLSIIAKRAK